MLALIRDDGNEVRLSEMPEPVVCSDTDVLIRVKAAAVCSTDAAIVSGAFGGTTPRILGHEVAGEVVGEVVGVEPVDEVWGEVWGEVVDKVVVDEVVVEDGVVDEVREKDNLNYKKRIYNK